MTLDKALETTVWDWWPLARLLITVSVFGLGAHYYLGWTPDLRALATLPRRIFEVLSFCALISFGLAHLYLILLMFPIYAVVTLNDTFYNASLWTACAILRIRSSRCLAISGLFGEILLFGGASLFLSWFVARM